MHNSKPDWQRVAALFEAALDRRPDDRAEFVRRACADDAALLAELDSLLAAHDQGEGFLEGPALTLLNETRSLVQPDRPDAALRFAPGQRFGTYRINRLLGRGGMGEVYDAEHLEHGRRVAVKVLNERLTDPADRHRFLREGQLAASVNHPNVVYVFGSEDIDGTAVIVMELLPGGTLKDLLRERGRLPSAEAVDSILQVVAGLDAARAGGVLHRDIKPSNCFVDRDGTVKIGDFGLSKSTALNVTQITETGTLRATPQFAAPEQLKGEPPDVRADIYGVGATLYCLLTGRPPFDHRDLLALLTRVVTEMPASPRDLTPEVPRGLAAVVLRCLAKDPSARFANYAALRKALAPFASAAPVEPQKASRFAAAVVDSILVLCFFTLVTAFLRTASGAVDGGGVSTVVFAIGLGTYFALTEGLGGASLGKWIFGLQVTDREGGPAGLVRAAARSAVFAAVATVPYLIPMSVWVRALLAGDDGVPRDPEALAQASTFVNVASRFAPLALFVTARQRHGFSGVHELVSGTRVSASTRGATPASSPAGAIPTPFSRIADVPGAARLGPYLLGKVLQSDDSSRLWFAYDATLKRHVWVREAAVGTPLAGTMRRDLSRRGRLRWLGGRQEPSGTWEAFEAPPGTSLAAIAAVAQPWEAVRQWLADLIEELACAERDGSLPFFDAEHVWITPEGRAMLLDFPAPGGAGRDAAAAVRGGGSYSARVQALLRRVAADTLAGASRARSTVLPVRPPLPPPGTALVRALDEAEPARTHDLLTLCRRALQTATTVPRRSRALVPAVITVFFMVGVVTIGSFLAVLPGPPQIGAGFDQQALFNGLVLVNRMDRGGIPESDPERRAIEIYLAGRYTPLATRASSFGGVLRPYRQVARRIAERHTAVSEADLRQALNRLGRRRLDQLNEGGENEGARAVAMIPVLWLPIVAVFGAASLLLALLLRGGLILRLSHLVLVDGRGNEVGRWRALWRAGVAWAPVFALTAGSDWIMRAIAAPSLGPAVVVGVVTLTVVVGVAWAVAVPERGLQERLSGTWIVPG